MEFLAKSVKAKSLTKKTAFGSFFDKENTCLYFNAFVDLFTLTEAMETFKINFRVLIQLSLHGKSRYLIIKTEKLYFCK